MIPVSLRLKNFLSYGTAAEALDFEAFSVACLSGANGQGKSALLDAVTWAVWGEARKSSDSRKPDDELLRIGAREMEVELVFDLEGTRYRIVRAYQRSATGKTSKPGLEFHVYDPESGEYRPLTAESVRATQAVIDARLGIDYDTFINSAFLLQGRSDEFTRKKPGERKEILGKILGLDRYGRLSAAASGRYTEARERAKRHETEVDRLKGALEDEPQWKTECAEVERLVAEGDAARERLRAEEAALAERLASLDERVRDAERLRDALVRLAERRRKRDAEAESLAARIAEAEALVDRAEALTADYERYEALLQERRALDEQAALFRGFEAQIGQQRLVLQEKRMALEGRLNRLRDAVASDRQRLDDDDRRLAERPRLVERLAAAEDAERSFRRLQQQEAKRKALRQRITHLDTRLSHAGGHLKGELNTLRKQLADARAAVVPVETLQEEEARLAASVAEVEAWQREKEVVYDEGTGIKERLAAAAADRARLAEAVADLEERRGRLRSTEADACPTCGTELTEAHRRHVEATYEKERERLRAKEDALAERIRGLEAERDGLRQQFVALRTKIESANGAATRLVQVRSRLERHAEEQAANARRSGRADEIERLLQEEAFEPEVRAERTALQDQLDAFPFDEQAFEALRAEAAPAPVLRERRDELDTIAARRDDLARRVKQQEEEAARLRADLDAGRSLAPLQQQLDALTARRDGLGYDGARHEGVARELQALAEAPKRFTRLMEAQRSLTEWTRRRAELADEEQALNEERAKEEEALAAAEAVLAERPEAIRRHTETVAARSEAELRLSAAQSRLGALQERLERCARDREALKEAREAHREARHEATLYRHLRSAFGKHGIPSLIIEETLPEIEDRANALLERLSNGRTRVALETLADKKAGGTKETLDIRITDDQGVARPYETFSGGEAFRVNFALRIALAQLLAERAGVRIRTLVVDEGFGTQDKEGIQNLVEAIRTIQDDFDKILVITHLDELKDAFPIRIEVTKRPVEGSTFEIVGV